MLHRSPQQKTSPVRRFVLTLPVLFLVLLLSGPAWALPANIVRGQPLPDATLIGGTHHAIVQLDEMKGRVKILSIVPQLNTPVCDEQTHRFSENKEEADPALEIVTISTNTHDDQTTFADKSGIDNITFLSDAPDFDFGNKTGLLYPGRRILQRAVIVVDANNIVRYLEIVPMGQLPDIEAAMDAARRVLASASLWPSPPAAVPSPAAMPSPSAIPSPPAVIPANAGIQDRGGAPGAGLAIPARNGFSSSIWHEYCAWYPLAIPTQNGVSPSIWHEYCDWYPLAIPARSGVFQQGTPPENPHADLSDPMVPPPGIIGVALHLTAERVGGPAGLFIRATHPMGPAVKAGLMHGQEILAVDGQTIKGKTYREVVAMIRGEVGTSVTLLVKHMAEVKEVQIVRVSEDSVLHTNDEGVRHPGKHHS
ncbi:MAG: redoxin family protein [Nitrospira sp.]|nr:redoxin family protein [Nitrospira sp.]